MIINSLCDYYDLLSENDESNIAPYGFERVGVSYSAVLSEAGELVQIIPLSQDKKQKLMLMPKPMKTSGIAASPVCDNFTYIFGVEGKSGEKKINERKFLSAKELHKRLFSDLKSKYGKAIVSFFENWDIESAFDNKILMAHYSEKGEAFSGRIVFRLQLEEKYFHEDEEIIKLWHDENRRISHEKGEYIATCAITGKKQNISLLHNQLSGVKGAQSTGASLICYNKDSDESYNFEKSYNSQISDTAMFKYTTALKYMLSNQEQKMYMGEDTVVFWAMSPENTYVKLGKIIVNDPNLEKAKKPDIETIDSIRAILDAGKKGIYNFGLDTETKFFILGLSPNAGRISVRFFYNQTFAYFCEKIKQHYDDMQIYAGERAKRYLSIHSLLYATLNSNSTNEKVKPLLGGSLMRSIMFESSYPNVLFNQVIVRVKAESFITHARASILKGYLNRKSRYNKKEEEISMYLNEENKDIAYVLGRTFAVLEMIQKNALGENINATIKDKFFASACSNPALVFPNLLKLSQHHLAKIEGNYWDIQLSKCIGKIESTEFPKTMSMDRQGKFILGYYQQVQKFYQPKNKENKVEEI